MCVRVCVYTHQMMLIDGCDLLRQSTVRHQLPASHHIPQTTHVYSRRFAQSMIALTGDTKTPNANLYTVQGSGQLEMHKLTGRRPVVTRTHCAVETEICMHMSCACSYCTEYATFEMLRLAGRRPAMKRTHCVAKLEKKHEIDEFMFCGSPYKQSFL